MSKHLICGSDLYRVSDHAITYLGKVFKIESWRLYTFVGYTDVDGKPGAVIDETINIAVGEIIEVAAIRV